MWSVREKQKQKPKYGHRRFWAIWTRMWVLPIAPSKCTCGQGPGTFECNLFSLTISHILLGFLFVFCFVNVSELDSLRRNFKWENTSIKLPCRWTCGMFSWLRIAVGGASSLGWEEPAHCRWDCWAQMTHPQMWSHRAPFLVQTTGASLFYRLEFGPPLSSNSLMVGAECGSEPQECDNF